jgi:hypothetical protein
METTPAAMNSKRRANLFIIGSRVGEGFEVSRPVSATLVERTDNPAYMSRFGLNMPNPCEYEYHSFSSEPAFPCGKTVQVAGLKLLERT